MADSELVRCASPCEAEAASPLSASLGRGAVAGVVCAGPRARPGRCSPRLRSALRSARHRSVLWSSPGGELLSGPAGPRRRVQRRTTLSALCPTPPFTPRMASVATAQPRHRRTYIDLRSAPYRPRAGPSLWCSTGVLSGLINPLTSSRLWRYTVHHGLQSLEPPCRPACGAPLPGARRKCRPARSQGDHVCTGAITTPLHDFLGVHLLPLFPRPQYQRVDETSPSRCSGAPDRARVHGLSPCALALLERCMLRCGGSAPRSTRRCRTPRAEVASAAALRTRPYLSPV